MDVLSLPIEMSASIMMYTDYPTTIRLRKVNKQMNHVAKTYKIGSKFPVTTIRFSSGYSWSNPSLKPWRYEIDLCSGAVHCHPNLLERNVFELTKECNKNDGSHLDIIDRLLKRVKLLHTLYFPSFSLTVDDPFLEVLTKNRRSLLKMKKFIFCDTASTCSNSSVQNFLTSFKCLRDYNIRCTEPNMVAFCHTELFENREWDNISLRNENNESNIKCTTLNDEFLVKIVKNCKRFNLEFGEKLFTSFTIDGVVEMVKVLMNQKTIPEYVGLGRIYVDDSSFESSKAKLISLSKNLVCTFEKYFNPPAVDGIPMKVEYCMIHPSSNPQHEFIRFAMCRREMNQNLPMLPMLR